MGRGRVDDLLITILNFANYIGLVDIPINQFHDDYDFNGWVFFTGRIPQVKLQVTMVQINKPKPKRGS